MGRKKSYSTEFRSKVVLELFKDKEPASTIAP